MNQQEAKAIVLDYLKNMYGNKPNYVGLVLLDDFWIELSEGVLPVKVVAALTVFSPKTEYELLAEFAAWGLKEGAKG
ncbi:hypothetical protein Q876_09000 [Listeria monocytogenes]|nr:hypothetical protein [Listeria monocytogenes]